jgi:hypothetical protein
MKNGMIALVCVSVLAVGLFAAAQGFGERDPDRRPSRRDSRDLNQARTALPVWVRDLPPA